MVQQNAVFAGRAYVASKSIRADIGLRAVRDPRSRRLSRAARSF